MSPWTLTQIENVIRTCWAADTCSPDDQSRECCSFPWRPDNPAWGHCDVTALVVNDLLGGDLIVGKVYVHGVQHGYHWWNRLAGGAEVDLTREQFRIGQTIAEAQTVERPPGPTRRRWGDYLVFRRRVMDRLR